MNSETKEKKLKKITTLRINFFILFAFCFLIYMPKFNIPSIILNLISYGVPSVYILLNINILKHLSRRQAILIFLIFLLLFFSCLFPLINNTNDFSYFSVLLGAFRLMMSYVALLCLTIKRHGEEMAMHYFMYYYVLVHVVYVAVTIMMVCIPALQNLWFTFVKEDSMIGMRDAYLFRVGWYGFSGFRLTLHCTFSVIFALYLRYGTKFQVISTKQFIFPIIFCIMGNMFYGRSGLIISIVLCFLSFLYWNRKKPKRIVAFLTCIIIAVGGVSLLQNIPGLSDWFKWMSSPIVSLVTTGDIQDSSFDTLQEMQQVEIPDETFIFGDGYYTMDGHYYMNTDVGFIRNILFWGIIGAIVSYGATLYAIFGLAKTSRFLAIQLLIAFLAFEYKGAVYYEFLAMSFVIETALSIERHKRIVEKSTII